MSAGQGSPVPAHTEFRMGVPLFASGARAERPAARAAFTPASLVRPLLTALLYLAVAAAGAGLSFDFGLRAGGAVLGFIAALNGAVFATILVDAARDAWRRRVNPAR